MKVKSLLPYMFHLSPVSFTLYSFNNPFGGTQLTMNDESSILMPKENVRPLINGAVLSCNRLDFLFNHLLHRARKDEMIND